MLLGILLAITWLVLLIRYPHKALPVSLIALCVLLLLISYAVWDQQQSKQRLEQLPISLSYAPEQCSTRQPLLVELHNNTSLTLVDLRWKLYVSAAGKSANLVQGRSPDMQYDSPNDLIADAHWKTCLSMPALTPGYRPADLAYKAVDIRGSFTHSL